MENVKVSNDVHPLADRRCGILLHPSSLPGPGANGELGPEAFRFVDFLEAAGHTLWQMLPLGPTHDDGSPYLCLSVHAGNPELISLDALHERAWLERLDGASRAKMLADARAGFLARATDQEYAAYSAFCFEHAHWLEDYALYAAIRQEQAHRAWMDWPRELRDRHPGALRDAAERLADSIEQVRFEQFVFFDQWHALRDYANQRGILLFGDMPIFVAHDSADVWAKRHLFQMDSAGHAEAVAGVPPDYFSETGQRWGNPLYDWHRMEIDDFGWWRQRMATYLDLFDLIRIDHFRGFEAYWAIPAAEPDATGGEWVKAPGEALFTVLQQEFGELPVVAEDLGFITPAVHDLRVQFGFPGMKVLQFAFGGNGANPYLPHNFERDCVVYTGTHDNDTTLAWYGSLDDDARRRVDAYLGFSQEQMPWPLIRAALASAAVLAVIPMQDVLALGGEHRMNRPGTTEGNWQWRFSWDQAPLDLGSRLRFLATLYGRI